MNFSTEQKIERGQMWWAELPKDRCNPHSQHGLRPVVVVSSDKGNLHSPNIIVCPLTTQEDKFKFIHPNVMGHNHTISYVQCEQIRVIDRSMIGQYIGRVREVEQEYIDRGLITSLALLDYVGNIRTIQNKVEELESQLDEAKKTIEILTEENTKLKEETECAELGKHVKGIFSILMNDNQSNLFRQDDLITLSKLSEGIKLSSQPSCKAEQPDTIAVSSVYPSMHASLSPIEKFNTRLKKGEEIRKVRERDTSDGRCDKLGRPSAQKWTDQKIREFVKDYPNMETEDLLKKYDLTNHRTADKYYLRFTNGQSL